MRWKAKTTNRSAWQFHFALFPHHIQEWWVWLGWYEARPLKGSENIFEERRVDVKHPPSKHDISPAMIV